MRWTSDDVRALRKERGETQGAFAAAVGVDRTTVSRWETGEVAVSDVGQARLDALQRTPASPSADYLRGVRDAADAIRATLAELERAAADAAVIAAASAIDAELSAGDESGPTETDPGGRRTTLRLERGGSAPPADA